MGSSDEETGRFGEPGLLLERHPWLQKGAELCEKTVKTPFWLQKAKRQNAEVAAAHGVTEFRGANYAKMCEPRLQKECGQENSLWVGFDKALDRWRRLCFA